MHTEPSWSARDSEARFAELPTMSAETKAASRRRFCSVIVPVYNEYDNVAPLHDALCAAADAEPAIDWEFLFVEDGSTDNSFSLLAEFIRTDPRIKVVRLSRNYGSHVAMTAGLRFAGGDAAIILPADLQAHPREIPRFISKWREGFDVVWGVRATRQDSPADRMFSSMFSALIRRIALPNYPTKGTGGVCLLDRKVIDGLNAFPEHNRLMSGLILLAGFRQTQIEYDRLVRHAGVSKWSLRRKIKLTVDTVVSFSSVPIRATSVLGVAIAAFSFAYAAYLIVHALFYGRPVEGWTTTIVVMLGLGGLQLFVLGMLGEYLWRVGDEVRRRPLFLVQELAGKFSPVSPEVRWTGSINRAAGIDA